MYWTWSLCIGSALLLFVVGVLWAVVPYITLFSELALSDAQPENDEFADGMSQAMPRMLTGLAMVLGGGVLAVVGFVCWARMCYRAWRMIHCEYTAMTPNMALVLLFVPLFNVYWMFVATFRLASGLNRVAKTRGIRVSHVPGFLGVLACGLGLATLLCGGWDVSPYTYLATSTAASLTFVLFFYCVQRTAGQITKAGSNRGR